MTQRLGYLACTYYDLSKHDLLHPLHLNLNIPQGIWGSFSKLQDAIEYVKMIRKRKTDTLFGAWDIYEENWDTVDRHKAWTFSKIVHHFPPRANHDFYGNKIDSLKLATIDLNS